jgi:hypothetical protein
MRNCSTTAVPDFLAGFSYEEVALVKADQVFLG